jgi:hypothetical protein
MGVPTAEEKFTAPGAAVIERHCDCLGVRQMREFLDQTVSDMVAGRESWRVISALGSIAFAAGVLWALT